MDIHIDRSGPFAVAKVSGAITAAEAEDFAEPLEELASGSGAALAIDLSGVTTLDSSALGAMIRIVTRSRLTEGQVVFVAPSAFLAGILEVTRLDQWLEICEDMKEAERRLLNT